jgi:hypothetical protein
MKKVIFISLFFISIIYNLHSQDLVSGGDNSWIFHTPDDGRTTMYIAPKTINGWDWGNATRFLNNGNIEFSGSILSNSITTTGDVIIGQNQSSTLFRTKYNGGAIQFKQSSDSYDRFLRLGSIDNNGIFHTSLSIEKGDLIVGSQTTHDESIIRTRYNGGAIKFKSSIDSYDRFLRLGSIDNNGIFHNVLSIEKGNVAIYGKLEVEEIKVTLNPTADFVFEEDYDLREIDEVESFIKENKHLPDFPSGKEIEENGVNLGEMDAKLLQKIEELNLYVIDINKEVANLKKENNILKEKLNMVE